MRTSRVPRSPTSSIPTPGLRARAEAGELAFGTVDSWLVWRLTGGRVHVTDVSNASRTLLFDIHRARLGSVAVRDRWTCRGRCCRPWSAPAASWPRPIRGWFGAAIPIAGIAGDQQAATFGQACFRPGSAKNTYGTGAFLLQNMGDQPVAAAPRPADHGPLAAG